MELNIMSRSVAERGTTPTGARIESVSAAENPIIAGMYPDPTICRAGEYYYLATSSFEYFPGAPIFRSKDLTNWSQIGHILTRRSQFSVGDRGPSKGIYGSTLRHHDGRFWFVTTNANDYEAGQLLVSAADPSGPWSEPVMIPNAIGIDPDIAWDGETCYLTWKRLSFTDGDLELVQAVVDLESGEIGPTYQVWQGTGMTAAEGPHLYRVGGYWYLMLAEGGTERGHTVTVARSQHPYGPFEACPQNPILTHRSLGHSVQNAGHADLVQTHDGGWAAVYLGVRARGSIPGFHVLGRETFLSGISWVDGWPVFDEHRYHLVPDDHGFVDDFTAGRLDLRWVVPGGQPTDAVALSADLGLSFTSSWRSGADLLCARVRDLRWESEALVEGDVAHVLRLDDRHWYGVVIRDGIARAEMRIGDLSQSIGSVEVDGGAIIRIEAVSPATLNVPLGHAGPDDIILSVEVGSIHHELARLDGRYLSSEVASGFTGRVLGFGSPSGHGVVRSVRYKPAG
ncbi:family 43 glycosylhydrolase [Microbacterium sp. NPDC089698]|uniref:glycoside hydrolase family 43 protein n=1 Tax=Microbacterium sp. NPDC089698 TaxID=3364200 RepID=UPI003821469C